MLVTLQASVEGEDVRARIVHVERARATPPPRSKGPADVRARRGAAALDRRAPARQGEGEVSLVVMLGPKEGEVEIRLPGRYAVTGAIAGALKAAPGVVAVEHV